MPYSIIIGVLEHLELLIQDDPLTTSVIDYIFMLYSLITYFLDFLLLYYITRS